MKNDEFHGQPRDLLTKSAAPLQALHAQRGGKGRTLPIFDSGRFITGEDTR